MVISQGCYEIIDDLVWKQSFSKKYLDNSCEWRHTKPIYPIWIYKMRI